MPLLNARVALMTGSVASGKSLGALLTRRCSLRRALWAYRFR